MEITVEVAEGSELKRVVAYSRASCGVSVWAAGSAHAQQKKKKKQIFTFSIVNGWVEGYFCKCTHFMLNVLKKETKIVSFPINRRTSDCQIGDAATNTKRNRTS